MNVLEIGNPLELHYSQTEAINQVRVSLDLMENHPNVITITSSIPGEGKSFTAINLWKSIADVQKKALLIDCDIRKSQILRMLGVEQTEEMAGLTKFLSGEAKATDTIYATTINNAYIIPVEKTIANPSPLLAEKKLPEIIDVCRNLFDYVLIDTPPLGAVADAMSLAANSDGCILVIGSGLTTTSEVKDSIKLIEKTGKPLLGIVLNKVKQNKRHNKYYKYREYYQE